MTKEIDKLKSKIVKILKKYGIKKAGIFGSYARGEQKKNSDVDILVELKKGMGLEFVKLGIELEEKLKKRVDLVSYKYIHPKLKNQILEDEIKII